MAKTAKGLQNCYNACSEKVRQYFEYFSFLLDHRVPYEIIIAYMFQRVEYAQRMSIYCSIIKVFKTDVAMTDRVIFSWDMTRENYQKMVELILNKKIPEKTMVHIQNAADNRDKSMHGKNITEQDKRTAIVSIFEYAEEINKFFLDNIGFEPFGKLQGWAGQGGGGEKINPQATRFVLKGLGLPLQ